MRSSNVHFSSRKTDFFFLSDHSALSPRLHPTLGVSRSPLPLTDSSQSFSPHAIMVGPMVGSEPWRTALRGLAVPQVPQWSILYLWAHGRPPKTVSASASPWSSPGPPEWSQALFSEYHSTGTHLFHGMSKTAPHVPWDKEVAGRACGCADGTAWRRTAHTAALACAGGTRRTGQASAGTSRAGRHKPYPWC